MDLMGNPPQGEDTPPLDIGEQLTIKAAECCEKEANAGWTRRLSSLFNAVFSIHLQPVLNHTFQCVLRVGNAIVCLFPAGSWRCWCRRPVCKKSMCVSRVVAYAGVN